VGLILSKIGDLINKLCPNGVEYKELNTLINDKVLILINAPVKLKKENYKPIGEYPIIDQGHKFIIAYSDDKNALIKKDLYVIFGDHTELFKFVDFGFIQGADGIKILKTKQNVLNTKYFYYAVSNYYIQTGKYTRHFVF
jgi:type I restriction enzyme S subunit